ncbi:hypothetical protein [Pararobbsia alpina]|uniref:Uncharacterized protein n=1 Tax=Pararobbsia alpina TaxID=621374 RepID=A0A6S7BNG8_9BURK|nr:hypothetical protein [Pararobbsia alpina]CAB3807269.1 hypothetical protein LMG28138_05903 [Pararobbsia alpina]
MNNFLDLVKCGNWVVDFFKGRPENKAPHASGKMFQREVTRKAEESLTAISETMPTLSKSKIPQMSKEIGGLIASDKFMRELSLAIGGPNLGEGEDTFVRRCKESLHALIDKHLSKN